MKTLPKIEYDLEFLTNELVALMGQLTERRMKELNWIETSYIRVKYSDSKITDEVKESTKNLAAALSVLFYVVVIEAYFPNKYLDSSGKERNLWQEIHDYGWLSIEELEKLRAYRHVRHSIAHDPDGKRAKQNYSTFTKVMEF